MHPHWLRCSSLKYCPIFSVVAPCHRGASPASVRRRDFHHGLLTCALATGFAAQSLTAQAPLTVPDGIPAWAFNIPDKIQPPGVRPEGTVRVPGSAKEYDAA